MSLKTSIENDVNITIQNWLPIVGEWSFKQEGQKIIYHKPQENKEISLPIGICLSEEEMTNGEIEMKIHLSPSNDKESNGRFILGYRSLKHKFLLVGLGGYGCAYTVSEFDPNTGFKPLLCLGAQKMIQEKNVYDLKVKVSGQTISLLINNIRAFHHILNEPLSKGQTGLFCYGDDEIICESFRIKKEEPKVFVVMQFSEPYATIYSDVIQMVAKKMKLKAYNVGEISKPGIILQDIIQGLDESNVIIAEITPPNQNVFYELGYAHALKKPTILLAEKGKSLPFDISGHRCIFYENSIGGKNQLEEELVHHLKSIVPGNGSAN